MGRRTGSRQRIREQVMNMFSLCQQMVTFFVLVSFVMPMLSSFTQGRTVPSQAALSQVQVAIMEKEARVMRSEIGSRPPRCAGRCYLCGHCEAIQVPTNPQVAKLGSVRAGPGAEVLSLSTTTGVNFRGDYGSNYKPMSWKCKCGNNIFNP